MKKKIKVFVLVGMIVMGFNSCRPAQNLRPLNKKPKGKSKLLYFLDQKNQGLETEDGMSDKKKYILQIAVEWAIGVSASLFASWFLERCQ